MWSYYGAKTNVVDYFPAPKHGLIIEPFAGTARYSLKHFENDVILVDPYETLIDIWHWLQQCSPKDILKLPRMKYGEHCDKYSFDCKEARDFMGFLMGFSTESPRRTATLKLEQRPNYINYSLKRIAGELYKIKHWDIRKGVYTDVENQVATWFIDPPYKKGGHKYRHSSKKLDFDHIAKWSMEREGFVMVCESKGATWLPFKTLATQRTMKTGQLKEMVWINEPTVLDNIQQKLAI